MRHFRYQAMDSTGKRHKGHVRAKNAHKAEQTLLARGSFVVSLNEATDAIDKDASSEAPPPLSEAVAANDNGLPNRRLGIIASALGLVCLGIGLYGMIDSVQFGVGAKRLDAVVVDVERDDEFDVDVLEYTISGRKYRVHARGVFGFQWGESRKSGGSKGVGSRIPILYRPERPQDARLAGFAPRFGIPLMLFALAWIFTPGGYFILKKGNVPRFLTLIYAAVFVAICLICAIIAIVLVANS